MEKKNSNKKYISFGIIIFLWLLLIGSLSYAYFSVLFDNSDKTNTDVVTGLLSIDFETGQYIDNSSMWPIDDQDLIAEGDKSAFSVSRSANNTVDNVYYNISLTHIAITDNYKSADLKWVLYDTNNPTSETTPISSGNFSNIGTNTSIQLNQSRISLPNNVTHNYSLFIWISNSSNRNQIGLLNGRIEGKILITAVTE